jgi:hypothetical protein
MRAKGLVDAELSAAAAADTHRATHTSTTTGFIVMPRFKIK